MIKWNFIDLVKPCSKGRYLAVRSEPYCDNMSIDIEYWDGQSFSYAGANNVLFWSSLPEMPTANKKLRCRDTNVTAYLNEEDEYDLNNL